MSYRVACLGAGYFAQFHHDGWMRNPNAELVGVCDLDIEKTKIEGVAGFTDLDAMLNRALPDILDIATPPPTHADAIKAGLHHGLKAIICQKPFCNDLAEAEDITKTAEEAGVPLIVHENFRFQPWYRMMKQLMDTGEIGEVHQATFRLRTGDGQGPDAYLNRQPYFQTMPRLLIHETGVHFIDTFAYLLGEPRSVYADLRRMNPVIAGEDAAYMMMEFDGGKTAMFDGNRLLDHAADNTRVTLGEAMLEGTKGTMQVHGDGSLWIRRFGEVDDVMVDFEQSTQGFGGDCVYALQEHVTNGLDGKVPLENQARDYLMVRRVEDAAYRSDAQGRKMTL